MQLSRGSHGLIVPPASEAALNALQAESWRLLRDELLEDARACAELHVWRGRRAEIRPQLLALRARFSAGTMSAAELRAAFDRGTKTGWGVLGAQGISGAMFLNALVKHAPDAPALDRALRAVFASPADEREAEDLLRGFAAYLDRVRESATAASARLLHPAHAVFFASLWWYAQAPGDWPLFHPSTRQTLELEEELFVPVGEPVGDYSRFRRAVLALARALACDAEEVEYLCRWHSRREQPCDDESVRWPDEVARARAARDRRRRLLLPDGRRATGQLSEPEAPYRAPAPVADVMPAPTDSWPELSPTTSAPSHTQLQWLLATIGTRLGCRVWIATNDHGRLWQGESLGALSVDQLPPLGLHAEAERLVRLIDVVWLGRGNQVAAAFEVERTTSVHAGLLRMADLVALSPNLSFPLYVVTPRERLDKVRRELSRPTFQLLELHRRCGYFSGEELVEAAPQIMRWAGGPVAIERLASRVADVLPTIG